MTTTYLKKTVSTRLDATGAGRVSLRPDVGQYWNLRYVTVATKIKAYPTPSCVVYCGASTTLDETTYVDDTNLGSGDSSSFVSGQIVGYGEGVTAVWEGGNALDNAVLTIVGTVADVRPTSVQDVGVPGARFLGRALEQMSALATGSNQIVAPLSPISTAIFDVRSFQAYYLNIGASSSGAASFVPLSVTLSWFDTLIGTNIQYSEIVHFLADTGAPFTFVGQNFFAQDVQHGPYMRMTLATTILGSPNITVSYQLNGTTRTIYQPYQRHRLGVNGILVDIGNTVIGAGATHDIPAQYSYGRVLERVTNVGANPIIVSRFFDGVIDEQYQVAAGVPSTLERIFPKQACTYTVTSVAGSTYTMKIKTQFDKV